MEMERTEAGSFKLRDMYSFFMEWRGDARALCVAKFCWQLIRTGRIS